MATSTFSYAEINTGFTGYFDLLSNVAQRTFTQNSIWSGAITGTEATLKCGSYAASPYRVFVDGVASNPSISSGAITLFTGLADEVHNVFIIMHESYTNSQWLIIAETEIMSVTGAAPAMTTTPVDYVSWTGFNGISTASKVAAPGGNITPTGSDYKQVYPATAARGSLVISSKCDEIYVYTDYDGCWLSIDGGTPVYTDFVSYTSYRKPVKLDVVLDDTAEHTYAIWGHDQSTYDIQGVITFLAGVKVTLSAISKLSVYQFGDSITYGTGASPGDVDCWAAGAELDTSVCKIGVPGQTTAELTLAIPGYFAELDIPDYALCASGRNDIGNASLQTEYEATIQAFLDEGITSIWCRGILPEGAVLWPTENAAIEAAVDSFADPNIVFIDMSGCPAIATSDGTHPTAAGYITVKDYAVPRYEALLPAAGAPGAVSQIYRRFIGGLK